MSKSDCQKRFMEKKKMLVFTLDPEEYEAFQSLAISKGLSKIQLLRLMIRNTK
jgi:hypothetical protein